MAVAIKIRHPYQTPAGRKSWSERAANVNVVIQIPDCCLARGQHCKAHSPASPLPLKSPVATKSQPPGRVGPKALPMNVGPDKYQIAV